MHLPIDPPWTLYGDNPKEPCLDYKDAAAFVGCHFSDIHTLVRRGLLKPTFNPSKNAHRLTMGDGHIQTFPLSALVPIKAEYDKNRKNRESGLSTRQVCQRLGITHRQLVTDQPLEIALFDFLRARAQRGKVIQRAGSGGRAFA